MESRTETTKKHKYTIHPVNCQNTGDVPPSRSFETENNPPRKRGERKATGGRRCTGAYRASLVCWYPEELLAIDKDLRLLGMQVNPGSTSYLVLNTEDCKAKDL